MFLRRKNVGVPMDILTIMLIAVGLAMDAFAVSIAKGISINDQKRKNALIIASFFATFQMIMPVIGWLAGLGLKEVIMGIDHWIALGLLVLIGARMIYDSTKKEDVQRESNLRFHILLTLSVATSIDALMVGLSFAFLQTAIAVPLIVIGIVTFALSYVGFLFGNVIGNILGNKMKVVGGVILIAIGIKIFLEHMI
jgi:putative Mn2+ efflux pump MntP